MIDVRIHKVNETYVRIEASDGIFTHIWKSFRFTNKKLQYHPKVKSKLWDGYICMLDRRTGYMYLGLIEDLVNFCKENEYTYEFTFKKENNFDENVLKNTLDLVEDRFSILDHQSKAIDFALKSNRGIIVSATACHLKGEKILLHDGRVEKVEDIKVGDFLFGEDGTKKEVLTLFSGNDNIYKINPKNNREPIYVNSEHILHLVHTETNEIVDISVKNYLNKCNYFKHCHKLIYNNIPLEFEYNNDHLIKNAPYFIGLYLGDGHKYGCMITNIDPEVNEYIKEYTISKNCLYRYTESKVNKITKKNGSKNNILNSLRTDGIEVGFRKNVIPIACGDKYIPELMFTTSINFRKELLAGLIDTDGHLSNGSYYEFCSKSIQLSNDIKRLSVSLGLVVSGPTPKIINGTTYYITNIMGDLSIIPTKIKRKQQKINYKERKANPYRSGFDIESIGIDEYFGFQVEDSLYIDKNGIVNHNSGKSLIMYIISMYYLLKNCKKILIVVPRTQLVNQLSSDFLDYHKGDKEELSKSFDLIYSKSSRNPNASITFSTWQSLQNVDPTFFNDYDAILVDEAHTCKAKVLTKILENCINVKYKFGFTGTLSNQDDDAEIDELVLKGLFGRVEVVSNNRDLMDKGIISNALIYLIRLKYMDKELCKTIINGDSETKNIQDFTKRRKKLFESEVNFIVNSEVRNKYIRNIAMSRNGNTLIMFQYIEKQGKILYEFLNEVAEQFGKEVYYIDGNVDVKERDRIKDLVELKDNLIIISSYGTTSTGLNMKNIHNIILASGYKSRKTMKQTIGRGLRLHESKKRLNVFDIGDDFSFGKKTKNFLFSHFMIRVGIYKDEKFKLELVEYEIGNNNLMKKV